MARKKPKWKSWEEFCEKYDDSCAAMITAISDWASKRRCWPKYIYVIAETINGPESLTESDWSWIS